MCLLFSDYVFIGVKISKTNYQILTGSPRYLDLKKSISFLVIFIIKMDEKKAAKQGSFLTNKNLDNYSHQLRISKRLVRIKFSTSDSAGEL
jgi:hypothetical protein